ncbi:hypothetical protein BGW36DRAFT_369769 [Talaromyces proteolyticus]|uniref:Uncharacterized protein n=1 Tax=Talaromyces proteolyticus TaxID=1131652 RepID=A0AAD4KY43_9EURO|nr:uncharacterized protein BGW36DRAFT_369769 [Talaromyces proteolyticus]KAH8703690.1 hypothetical protein BGW36DRAFT_369769 [Talaromyces proteolyticus]
MVLQDPLQVEGIIPSSSVPLYSLISPAHTYSCRTSPGIPQRLMSSRPATRSR